LIRSKLIRSSLAGLSATATLTRAANADKKPNILVIWGDDVGINNISAYSLGMMGYKALPSPTLLSSRAT
jgi:arylsulfatase